MKDRACPACVSDVSFSQPLDVSALLDGAWRVLHMLTAAIAADTEGISSPDLRSRRIPFTLGFCRISISAEFSGIIFDAGQQLRPLHSAEWLLHRLMQAATLPDSARKACAAGCWNSANSLLTRLSLL